MEDNQPGTPKPEEPIKPKPSESNKPVFSYLELDLQAVIQDINITYLVFMVRGEFLIQVEKFEYFAYLDSIFTQIRKIQEKGELTCICDQCSPQYTIVDSQTKITSIEMEGEVHQESYDKFIPFYAVYELPNSTSVGIHDFDEDIKDNPHK